MRVRMTFIDDTNCPKDTCCDCCKKQGLQTPMCKKDRLAFDRYIQKKNLNKNEIKGMLLEKALSNALEVLEIRHNHNPFDITYPCYQNKSPDIIIEKLKIVIECKNLSKKQVDHLSKDWLDRNIIDRPYNKGYERMLVLFSYKPRLPLIRYLMEHCWKVYGLGTQILTPKEMQKAKGKLIRNFYWLRKEYYGNRLSKPKQQTRLKTNYLKEIAY
jgi:hypothetical protein